MKLKEYMKKEGKRNNWFCEKLRITPPTLWSWMNNKRNPPYSAIILIKELTQGYVTEDDWPKVTYQIAKKQETE